MERKFFTTIALILIASTCFCLVTATATPQIHRGEDDNLPAITRSDITAPITDPIKRLQVQQPFVTFLSRIAGINMKDYKITAFKASTSEVLGSEKQQICISATISSQSNNLSVAMELIEGKIRFYNLGLLSGSLQGSQRTFAENIVSICNAIEHYKEYFNAIYCEGFNEIIPKNIQCQNLTVNNKSNSLTIKFFDRSTIPLKSSEFIWYKNTDGRNLASQSVQVTVSKTGIVTSFADSLGLFKIGTTSLAITKEQAIDKALPFITAYAQENKREITNVNATLYYVTDDTGKKADSFIIYPKWTVSASFAKSESEIYGYHVGIWADSGEFSDKNELGSYSSENISSSSKSVALMTGAIVISFFLLTYICLRQYFGRSYKNRAVTLAIVVILLTGLFITVLSKPAFAYSSSEFGSRSGIPEWEQYLGSFIADNVGNWSGDIHVTPYNWYGTSTIANNLYTGAYDHGDTRSIVYYIGHGDDGTLSGDYSIFDNEGNWVTSTNIYDNSYQQSYDHHKFAMIWSCNQGDTYDMPNAWLHTTSLSPDGYHYSDGSGQVFVGFNGLAPYLSTPITSNDIEREDGGYMFLWSFFYYSMLGGYSVNDALDAATQHHWYQDFDDSVFYTGIPDAGNMVVYGCGNMYISGQRYVTVNCDSNAGYVTGLSSGYYDYGSWQELTAHQNSGYQFAYWSIDGGYAGNSLTLLTQVFEDENITAVFNEGSTVTLTVQTLDSGWATLNSNIYVDGDYAGTGYAEVSVQVGDHTIAVDDPVWNDGFQQYSYLQGFSDSGTNGGYRTISSNDLVRAWYWP